MRSLIFPSLVLLAALALTGAGVTLTRSTLASLEPPAKQDPASWATSEVCAGCHRDRHASWHRTYHRTMTQEASDKSVLGVFDGRALTYWGRTARPVKRDGKYWFDYLDPDTGSVQVSLPVLRTVGSHRYQQYLTQTPAGGDTYYRLHLLWHMETQRWVHINGAFLSPDEQDYDAHIAVWNHNCIFCHNTGPVPNIVNYQELGQREQRGEAINSAMEAKYSSSLAEMGIACEACHGPGEEHARRNRNPLRRYALHLSGRPDPTIVNPARLDTNRSTDVCGQCHGQRTPKTPVHQEHWITRGLTFRAGDTLTDHVTPLHRDLAVPAGIDPELFSLRFWPDRTPRLTAYEYQGLKQSACHTGGELTCITCHTMHDGDIDGMLPQEHRGNGACVQCHDSIGDDVAGHSKHAAGSAGSQCMNCHMPRVVFGLMDVRRSHRIEIPDPASNVENGRPNACTSCHLDETPVWAAQRSREWWGEAYAPPAARYDGAPVDVVDSVASLHAGDPLQRAIAARMAGRKDAPGEIVHRAFLVPHLLLGLTDNYPSTRRLAIHSLRSVVADLNRSGISLDMHALNEYDFIGDASTRAAQVAELQSAWETLDKMALPPPPRGALLDSSYTLDERETRRLIDIGHHASKQIDIGE